MAEVWDVRRRGVGALPSQADVLEEKVGEESPEMRGEAEMEWAKMDGEMKTDSDCSQTSGRRGTRTEGREDRRREVRQD